MEGTDPGAGGPTPAEQEELQRRLEQQLSQVRVQDLLLESIAGILNLSARRIAKADERDLEQGRIGIEAVRALLDLIDEGPRQQVREALSQVQMLYAREAQGGGEGEAGDGGDGGQGGDGGGEGGPESPRQGPSQGGTRPSGLWTPPGV